MSAWPEIALIELLQAERRISYGIVQPGEGNPDGVPIVRVAAIRGGRIDTSEPLRVAPEVEAQYARTRLRGDELLITLVGTVGETAEVTPPLIGWNVARAVGVIPVRGDVGARWVRYALATERVQHLIDSWCNTTVQKTLNLKDVARLPVAMPPEDDRMAIGRVLGALDDKIELNRRMNETLEALARALFKSWFVDFDPVHAKAEGRAPNGMDAATAALIPDGFEGPGNAQLPLGWMAQPLDGAASFVNGLALQKYPAVEGEPFLPVLKIAQLRAGALAGSDRANTNVPSDYVIGDGDLIFSWSGSLLVRIWTGGSCALNQHLFKVMSTTCPRWFVRGWLLHHLLEFQAIASAKATTMGHIQRHHLTEATVIIPPAEVLESCGRVIAPLEDLIVRNDIQSRTLEHLRDALLPKLLSGELRVRDAEKTVEQVA